MKWTGPAQWTKREAHAGDRLPFARHIDERPSGCATAPSCARCRSPAWCSRRRTRINSTMRSPCARCCCARARRALRALPPCRPSPRDRRFGGEFESPFCAAIDRRWDARLAGGRCSSTTSSSPSSAARRAARRAGRSASAPVRPAAARTIRHHPRSRSGTASLAGRPRAVRRTAAVGYQHGGGRAFRTSRVALRLYNGEMRPVVLPADGTDIGHHLPYRRVSFGLDAMRAAGAGGRNFSAMLVDQGLSRRKLARPARRHAAAAVRDGV